MVAKKNTAISQHKHLGLALITTALRICLSQILQTRKNINHMAWVCAYILSCDIYRRENSNGFRSFNLTMCVWSFFSLVVALLAIPFIYYLITEKLYKNVISHKSISSKERPTKSHHPFPHCTDLCDQQKYFRYKL